jgi:hypothetical protein
MDTSRVGHQRSVWRSLVSPRIRRFVRSWRSRAAFRDLRVDPLVSYAMILLESHTARVPIASTGSFPQPVDKKQVGSAISTNDRRGGLVLRAEEPSLDRTTDPARRCRTRALRELWVVTRDLGVIGWRWTAVALPCFRDDVRLDQPSRWILSWCWRLGSDGATSRLRPPARNHGRRFRVTRR